MTLTVTDLFSPGFVAAGGEVATTSRTCQRWRRGRPSTRWADPDDRFDGRRYEVQPVDEAAAKAFVLEHHYAASYPAARFRLGLFEGGELVGVAVFSVPAQARVLTAALPALEPYQESLELGRFVLLDNVPGNGESWFLARAFTELRARGVRGVVSFADPVRRVASDGTVIAPGHVGWIYQASNAIYTGRGTARTLTVLPDGTTLHARSAQKIRRQERGHEHVQARLVALGASPRRPGDDPARWLAHALGQVDARRVEHGGCHRYVFPLGRNRRERARVLIGLAARAYPKTTDPAWVSDQLDLQSTGNGARVGRGDGR
jgi:hypothetical protein